MALNGNYVFRETTANLTRNITLTVASVLTVFVSLAIVGTTVLVRQGAQNMTRQFEGGVEFIVYLDRDIKPEQLAAVKKDLEDNPGIKRSSYLNDADTFKLFKKLFKGQESLLKSVRLGDLPTSFRVQPVDNSVASVSQLASLYRKQANVSDVTAATDVIREVKGLTNFVNLFLTVFAGSLLVASGLLIWNTIRTAMFARRREIEVMKLVGATNWFIRVPFMLEGMVQGVIGGGFAVGFVIGARYWIQDRLDKSDGLKLLQNFTISSADARLASVIIVVTAVLLSVTSSVLATRRFLDV